MQRRIRRAPLLAIAGAAVLLTPLASCNRKTEQAELPPRAIRWQIVSEAAPPKTRTISGIVMAQDDTRLAFEVAGSVLTVDVNLGDRVDEGQALARLDPEPLELAVLREEAAVAEASAELELSRLTLTRTQRAADRDAASPQELDVAIATVEALESQLAAAQARLNLYRRDLRRSVLTAPFSGTISVRDVDPAMKVAAGETVFEMDSESGLRVEVQMPETLIADVRQGDRAQISLTSLATSADQLYEGRVSEVGTRAGDGNAFPVRIDIVDPPSNARPGMTAEVTFYVQSVAPGLENLDGFVIPISAVLADTGDTFAVFVFDRDSSTVSKRRVQTGGVRNNDLAVLDGLEEGEIIATAGVSFLHDGQEVTLFREARNGVQ